VENPRPEKVAVVDEVREKFRSADAVLLTEYRGLTVAELAELRRAMRAAGGEYRVYKNTLVRRATAELDLDLSEQLVGPTALAFVSGDVASVAKAVTDFAKTNPLLVLKGGVLGDAILDAEGAKALASLPTAAEIYARLAGALNFGARGLASVVSGVHRSLALVLQAAIDAGAFAGDAAPAAAEADAGAEADSAEVTAVTAEPAPAEEAAPAAEPAPASEAEGAAPEADEPTPDEPTDPTPDEPTEENNDVEG
jgi:large subunit ribosomal protein L10